MLDKLPQRLRPRAKRALRETMYAAARADAAAAVGDFVEECEAKHPQASGCLGEDQEALLAFFALPAEHWLPLRMSHLIETIEVVAQAPVLRSQGGAIGTAIENQRTTVRSFGRH